MGKYKIKKERIVHAKGHITQVYDLLTDELGILLLFSNKPARDIRINSPECRREIGVLLKFNYESILKKKLYSIEYNLDADTILVISKIPINEKPKNVSEVGKILGIPKCCVNQYSKEDDGRGKSHISAMRYLTQLKKLNIKEDKFEIFINNSDTQTKFGFIPCHPKCNKALQIVNKYNKIRSYL